MLPAALLPVSSSPTQYSLDRMRPDKGSHSVLGNYQADKFPAPTPPFKKQNIIYLFIYSFICWGDGSGRAPAAVCVEIRGQLEGLSSTLPPRRL